MKPRTDPLLRESIMAEGSPAFSKSGSPEKRRPCWRWFWGLNGDLNACWPKLSGPASPPWLLFAPVFSPSFTTSISQERGDPLLIHRPKICRKGGYERVPMAVNTAMKKGGLELLGQDFLRLQGTQIDLAKVPRSWNVDIYIFDLHCFDLRRTYRVLI